MAFLPPLLASVGTFLGSTTGAAVLTGASAAFTGLSAIQQGRYQAAVAKNNAKMAEENAVDASIASQREQMRSDRDYAAALGEQLARQGASGLDVLGRTQMLTREVTAQTGREQAGDIRQQGANTARRFQQDAANFRAEGRAAKTQGIVTAIGAGLNAATTISKDMGNTRSFVSSKRKTYPWDKKPTDWYGRG